MSTFNTFIMWFYTSLLLTLALSSVSTSVGKNIVADRQEDKCRGMSSCSSCITRSYCVWCVTKSKCTDQSCGNDNIIYPKYIPAIMSGPQFCPRLVEPEEVLTLSSGRKEGIVVKLTQIHLYMAFTPWRCNIAINRVQLTVSAVLLGDSVFCQAVLFTNKSNEPYVSGSVSVLWDHSKPFDGSIPFKVCRCDLDPSCVACKK